jgi:predicted metal-dependent phosphoesterase TrpH
MIDLHIHSTASDGTLTPEQIVARARELGMRAIALADHDSVAGIDPALVAAEGTGLIVLPAVEISTDWESTEIHVLGYFLDYRNAELLEKLALIREAREGRAETMVTKLQELGMDISYEAVLQRANGGSVGRPHVAAELEARGHVRSQNEAFDRYLSRDKPAYVPRYKLSYQDAIDIIRHCEGLPVLAHPGLVRDDRKVKEMLPALEGLEVYHTAHSAAQTRKYARLAREHGLLITGGTDSHGPEGSLPVEIGSVAIPNWEECLEGLLDWAREHGRSAD